MMDRNSLNLVYLFKVPVINKLVPRGLHRDVRVLVGNDPTELEMVYILRTMAVVPDFLVIPLVF